MTPQEQDAAIDHAYLMGYEQACREWSGSIEPHFGVDGGKISDANLKRRYRDLVIVRKNRTPEATK